jgi:hypothetical protein
MKWTDIDRLRQAELIDLNNRIVERFRILHQQMRAHARMIKFEIGGPSLFSRWVHHAWLTVISHRCEGGEACITPSSAMP